MESIEAIKTPIGTVPAATYNKAAHYLLGSGGFSVEVPCNNDGNSKGGKKIPN